MFRRLCVAVWFLLACVVPVWGQNNFSLGRRDAGIINPLEHGSTCTSGTLNAAIASAPSTQRTLMLTPTDFDGVPCVWAITANVTVPASMTLWVPQGASVSISSGILLTLNGPYEIYSSAWWSGAGNVVYNMQQTPSSMGYATVGCTPGRAE